MVSAAGLVKVGDSAAASELVAPRLGQAEVQHFHRAVGAHLDVGGFQIAMDDAQLVRRFERLGDLPGDRQRLLDRDRSTSNALRESSPSTSSITRACTPADFSKP